MTFGFRLVTSGNQLLCGVNVFHFENKCVRRGPTRKKHQFSRSIFCEFYLPMVQHYNTRILMYRIEREHRWTLEKTVSYIWPLWLFQ